MKVNYFGFRGMKKGDEIVAIPVKRKKDGVKGVYFFETKKFVPLAEEQDGKQ